MTSLVTTGGLRAEITPPQISGEFDHVYFQPSLEMVTARWQDDPLFYPTILTYGLTFTLGVLGNGLVVFSLLGDRKARNVTSSFLVSLAVADIVFLLVCVPYETAYKFASYFAGGQALCKIAGFVEMLSAAASVLNLTSVSVERYVVIVHPMRSRSYCTMGNTKKIIVSVWAAALVLSSPMLIIMDTESTMYYNEDGFVATSICADSNVGVNAERILFTWYQFIVMFIIPVIVMVACYAAVINVLWISTKELATMTQTTIENGNGPGTRANTRSHSTNRILITRTVKDHSAEIREARKQVIKMLLMIIGIFFLCWGPKLVLSIMKRHKLNILYTKQAYAAKELIHLLPFVQSCINPIIYSYMSKNFRRSMRTACRTRCRCDPTKCCRKASQKTVEFNLESRSMNGTSSKYSMSHNARQSKYLTGMTSC